MAKSRRNKKADILDAAIQLMARQGVRETTIRDIAEAVDITEGAIYRHFKSKDELLQTARDQVYRQIVESKRELMASDASPREKLREWIRLSYSQFDEDPGRYAFLKFPPPGSDGVYATELGYSDMIRDIFRESGDGQNPLDEVAIQVSTMMFLGMTLCIPWYIHRGLLKGPAMAHLDYIYGAALRALDID